MEEIKKYGIGCGAVLLLLIVLMVTMPFWSGARRTAPRPQETPGVERGASPALPPPPAPPKKSPEERIHEMTRAGKHAEAQELAVNYLSTGNDEEKAAARSALPSIYMRLFEEAASSRNLDRAVEIHVLNKALAQQSPTPVPHALKDGLRYMKEKIQDLRQEAFRELLAAGDKAGLEKEIERAWGDPESRLPEKETLEFLASTWLDAVARNDASAAQLALRRAAEFAVQDIHSISYWGSRRSPLEKALSDKLPYNDLLATGSKSLQGGDPVMALAYLSAAAMASSSGNAKNMPAVGTDAWLERQRLLCESYVGVALLAEDGKLRWLPPDDNFENKVEILLQHATRYVNDAERLSRGRRGQVTPGSVPPESRFAVAFKAWEGLFRVYRGKLRRICETQESFRVLSYCDDMLYEMPGRWLDFLERSCGPQKVLGMFPAEILGAVTQGKKTDQEKIFALKEFVRLKHYSPDFPGRSDFTGARRKARLDSAKKLLAENKYDDAFSFFRDIFRDDPSSEEALESRDMISAKIDVAGKSRDFDSIYTFASFLIGEMRGSGMPEELAKRLAPHLDSAAEFYKASSKMKRAFMLSLKADLLGDSAEGRTAATQAMEIGFEAVKELPLKAQKMESSILPSLLKGASVEAIKNQTGYHLMAFYNGPEKFFVRLNPYSKGSLALRDGEYEIAVVVTSDAVIPYRTKMNYAGGYYVQKYHIVKEGSKHPGQREDFSDMFMGKFQRLRTPDGSANATFDPSSGMFMENPGK